MIFLIFFQFTHNFINHKHSCHPTTVSTSAAFKEWKFQRMKKNGTFKQSECKTYFITYTVSTWLTCITQHWQKAESKIHHLHSFNMITHITQHSQKAEGKFQKDMVQTTNVLLTYLARSHWISTSMTLRSTLFLGIEI